MYDRTACTHRGARTDGGETGDSQCGVTVTVLNLGSVDAELVGEQTRKNGSVALPGRLHIAAKNELVAARKRNRGLLHRHCARMLQHAGDTDAAQLSPFHELARTLVEIVEVGHFKCPVDNRREIAAVIRIDWRLERHRRRGNEVFLAPPYGIDAGDPRRLFHHAFKCVVRFRSTGAAIGSDWNGVAE